jgi:metal-responsive CopG/Arc/MetJ family transcriptional regulator
VGTVNFSVPDDLKDAFNAAFAGQNKSAVIAELMREAVARAERRQRSRAAIERILDQHACAPVRDAQALQTARAKGRP